MDVNVVVLAGRLAAPPEYRQYESGTRLIRYLVTVRSARPRRRVDVVPVTQWNAPESGTLEPAEPGRKIWVVGAVQRQFWTGDGRRQSSLELIAHEVDIREPDDAGSAKSR